jgi:sarcosine oxidase
MERGASVTVYERGEPGAAQSGGVSRILRHAHDDERLVALTRDGRRVWDEWSARLGTELVSPDGAVAIGPAVERRMRAITSAGGIDARLVDGAELRERMPLLAAHPGPALFDADGGAIRTEEAVAALSEALGGRIVRDEVLGVEPGPGDTVRLRAGGATSEHGRVVVAAGRDTARIARMVGLAIPVRLGAHVRLTFAVRDTAPARLACLQDGSGDFGEVGAYGAAAPGNARFGLGISTSTEALEDGTLLDPAGLAALAERARGYVERALPGLDPRPVDVRHCWTTQLPWGPDGHAVWEAPGVLVVAGHNLFKQAPGLGRMLAAAATGEGLDDVLRPESRLGAAAG